MADLVRNPFMRRQEARDRHHDFLGEARRCHDAYQQFWRPSTIVSTAFGRKPCFLLDDTSQSVGSFKLRGASVAVNEAVRSQPSIDNIAVASTGNFGLAVAEVARRLGIRASIFMPTWTPKQKQDKIRALRATVNAAFSSYEDAELQGLNSAVETSRTIFLRGAARDVLRGNASLALEVVGRNLLGGRIALVVPLGIGSLALATAWIMQALSMEFDLITVEPATHCKYAAHLGGPKPRGGRTIAEGAAINEVPPLTWCSLDACVHAASVVDEAEIEHAIRHVWCAHAVRLEGAGALAPAAFLARPHDFRSYDQVWMFLTGRNVPDEMFSRCAVASSLKGAGEDGRPR